jgi:hypothetical protein
MMQLGFFDEPVEAPPAAPAAPTYAEIIAAQPEKLRPSCAPVPPVPTAKPELDAWVRDTQRRYLLYLVGAIARMTYRDSSIANARYVLQKLNGLGGEW